MGAFFGAVHIRGSTHDEVRMAAEKIATARAARWLLGPELSGWVTIYPDQSGQDHTVGAALAAVMPGTVLQLLLHDESVVAYWLYRGSALVDSFFSRPGYFDSAEREREEAMRGNADTFDDVIPGAAAKIRPHLARGGRVDEMGRFEAIARALDLPNATTSYEYLKGGESDGVRGWRSFVEIPAARALEEEAARAAATRSKDEARKAGRLLVDLSFLTRHRVEAVELDGEIVVCGRTSPKKARVLRCAPPWGKPRDVSMDSMVGGRPKFDPARARVVLACEVANAYAVDGELVAIPHPQRRADVGPDGKLVVHEAYAMPAVRPEEAPSPVPIERGETIVRHPSGHVIAKRNCGGIAIVAGPDGVVPRRDLALNPLPPRRATPMELKLAELTEQWQAMATVDVDVVVAHFAKTLATPDAKLIEAKRAEIEALKAKAQTLAPRLRQGGGRRPELIATVGFTRDGRSMWLGTERGLRVYDWPAVLAASTILPPHVHWFDTTNTDAHGLDTGYVYAATEDPERRALLFGGLRGILYRMDIAAGNVVELGLHDFAEPHMIVNLRLVADALVVERRAHPSVRSKTKEKSAWQIWKYDALPERSVRPELEA